MKGLGIDVGGSGIKGAMVDTSTGELVSDRVRFDTPQPASPRIVSRTIGQMVKQFEYRGVIGVSFPTIVSHGISLSGGNLHKKWVGVDVAKLLAKETGHHYVVNNDADLAGLAEMTLGVGRKKKGKVVMITIGTGLGSGFFYDGALVPNIEMGRLFGKDGLPIEFYAGDRARKEAGISWEEWGKRFDFFLRHIVTTFSPDLFILGGGACKKYEKFGDQITIKTPIRIARFRNNAGIIGAAMAASTQKQNTL